ncbi:MAG: phenylalanine--tRNA ligase subunit beta [Turicibacter sp.]|nr:phenylalanine--tRNA ligase subunit beta [Turicibacter sp.]
MLVSVNWLNKYIDASGISPEVLADKITRTGIEVESVATLANATNVVVGHVLERIQHPNADKLSVCQVDVGGTEGVVQIVCGAKNVAAGQKVIVAKNGAVLPGNFKIKKSKLRGEESNGMICSLKELGIEQRLVPTACAEGIFVCNPDAPVGTDAIEYLQYNDTIIELGLTPNRMDAMSMYGVAYEVGAILKQELNLQKPQVKETTEKAADAIEVAIETKNSPAFLARVIKNVTISESPQWLQAALIAGGIRPKNNVVDITNFVMLEMGQPLHAYDYDTIETKKIVVKTALGGEMLKTLDEQERKLEAGDLLITDGVKPIGLAGVMGGFETEVTDKTTNILLESALFDRGNVRKASARLGLRSEASSRFEKGVDPGRVELALDRAAELLGELAGGTVLQGIVAAGVTKTQPVVIDIALSKINGVLGTSMTVADVSDVWERLKFDYEVSGETFTVKVPSRRLDIAIPEDLIEEAGRIYGYDNIPMTLPKTDTKGGYSPVQEMRNQVRQILVGLGLTQVITYALTNKAKARQFLSTPTTAKNTVTLAMPMSEERSQLRQSLIPQLLETISYNNARTVADVAIFETGNIYNEAEGQYFEEAKIAGAVTGNLSTSRWQGKTEKADFYTAKGYVDAMLQKLGFTATYQAVAAADYPDFHPGRSAVVSVEGRAIGVVGQIHPEIQKLMDLNDTFVFEISQAALVEIGRSGTNYQPIPKHPGMGRDIALVVDANVQAGDLIQTIQQAATSLLNHVEVFDIYAGIGVEDGKKSVALSLYYLNREKTLTDEEVQPVHQKVLSALEAKHEAVLRG